MSLKKPQNPNKITQKETEDLLKNELFEIHQEIEAYKYRPNDNFLIDKLKELNALKTAVVRMFGLNSKYNSSIRRTGRLIRLKLLKNVDDIISAATPPGQASPIEQLFDPNPQLVGPNTALLDRYKANINAEFASFSQDARPIDAHQVYNEYLNIFNGSRIFTLKSETFTQDQEYQIGSSEAPNMQNIKYYGEGDYDTQCLLEAIIYRIKINTNFSNSKINKLISSYTYDPDADDLQNQAQDDLFTIFTVYGIVKRMTVFIATGYLDPNMRYLKEFKDWVDEEDEKSDPGITQLLLKRIGIMTELLWYVLLNWPIKLSPGLANNPSYNVKLYAGIGTSLSDANYGGFIGKIFLDERPHASGSCFHDVPNSENPQYPNKLEPIVSRDFVSTAYSFDAAAKFCKKNDCTNYCMLEFILEPGQTLPFIGASANEAEVLLKPGNIYRFIKRYKVTYTRQGFVRPEDMLIFVYQFRLINDTNSSLDVVPLPDPDPYAVSEAMPGPASFDFSSHPDWSVRINAFIDAFSGLAGVPSAVTPTQAVSSLSLPGLGGSKSKSKTKRRKHYKTKRRSNKKRRTNKNKNKNKTKGRRI